MSRTDQPWLLIVGGYEEDINESFLAFNKGLERRFTVKLKLEGYSGEELYHILMSFIKEDNWEITDNAFTVSDIESNMKQFKYFAGDMRKLLQYMKENYCLRMMKDTISLTGNKKELIRDDFINALTMFKIKENDDKYFHASMYL
jgi:hypothetical protein